MEEDTATVGRESVAVSADGGCVREVILWAGNGGYYGENFCLEVIA